MKIFNSKDELDTWYKANCHGCTKRMSCDTSMTILLDYFGSLEGVTTIQEASEIEAVKEVVSGPCPERNGREM